MRLLTRRHFVAGLGATGLGTALRGAAPALAQAAQAPVESPTPSQITGAPITTPEAPGATMQGEGYRPVRLPARSGATASMSAEKRDDLEHKLSCPCPCTLDVFTCRTSMPCGFSPAMHRDVMTLVEGGYSGDEILAAFEQVYGEQVLMAPKKVGFNWAGYVTPFAALALGGATLAGLMRRWSRRAATVAAAAHADQARRASSNGHGAGARDGGYAVDATPDELARLEAAVRGDGDR